MSLFTLATIAGIAAAANGTFANGTASYSTEVVTAYTTYCPTPTSFTEGNSTYVVTAPTTLTITDCPCTRTHTYQTKTVTSCSSSGAPTVGAGNATTAPILNGAGKTGISLAALGGAALAAAALI